MPARQGHKRVDTNGFYPLVNHPFPIIARRKSENGDRCYIGERQRCFSTVGAHSVRPFLYLYAVSDTVLLHRWFHLRRRDTR